METKDFLKLIKEKQALVELQGTLANRSINEGFSGGEKSVMKFSKWRYWSLFLHPG